MKLVTFVIEKNIFFKYYNSVNKAPSLTVEKVKSAKKPLFKV